ncbi:flagellar hook assembly protein FlgD [Pseudarthrobacter sp. NPDC092439]|uniref:flagellar hook assembly protein FlgD n=1 Tax=unclassified Pseudarthrobacter TaxID=2647000 RepID=UPI00380B16A4
MPIEAVTGARDAGLYTGAPARAPKQAMDGEVFMQLLVTQLQNQDPGSPMDTNEMIAQTTQLAMMEKLNELSNNAKENFSLQMRSAAAALIGQQVSYTGADGRPATGVATSVSYAGKVPTVTVDGQAVALDAVTGIAAGAS